MKKFRILYFIPLALLCLLTYAGCLFLGTVEINKWSFKPQQASGTEIALGSSMTFHFTVVNYGEERELKASTFNVSCVIDNNEYNAEAIYLDNLKSHVDFMQGESRNIELHVATTSSFSSSSKILIKYDGRTIVEYWLV